MEIIQSIILGIVQGITEFLPISSSGHLILIPRIFGWEDQGLAFDVALHWGTLLAVLLYFWKDWMEIFRESCLLKYFKLQSTILLSSRTEPQRRERSKNIVNVANSVPRFLSLRRLADHFGMTNKKDIQYFRKDLLFIIIIATIPGIITGLLLNNYAETVFRNPLIISATLFFGAVLLFYADRVSIKKTDLSSLTLKMGILIGLFQALAIIPGVSRSGITITAALLLGLKRTDAARFSFLLSTPIILGAGIKESPSLLESGLNINILLGVLVSAISGYLAIKYMLKYLENKNYNIFVGYRIVLVGVILFFILS